MPDVDVTHRRIDDGLHLIGGCVVRPPSRYEDADDPPDWFEPGHATHGPFNAYLLAGDETLLFDTTPPSMTEGLFEALDDLLDEPLDHVVVSHPEAPHGGNAEALVEAYGADLIVPESDPLHDHALESVAADRREVAGGDTLDLGGRRVEFVDPVLFDLASTTWMFDGGTGALFTVDAYGNGHIDDECGGFVDEIASDPGTFTRERWIGFHSFTFPWLAYADPERIRAGIEGVIERHQPSIVAPAHGSPIREDAVGYMRELVPVVEEISDRGLGQEVRLR